MGSTSSSSSSSTYGACVINVPDGQMATLSWQLKYSSGVLGKLIGALFGLGLDRRRVVLVIISYETLQFVDHWFMVIRWWLWLLDRHRG